MLKIFISAALATLSCTSPVLAKSAIMEEIADAGIYCATFSPAIGRFYSMVESKCKGKTYCRVSPTMVTTKQDLIQNRCTGFFVAPICKGLPVNVESRYDVFKTLLVSCKP